MATLCAQKVYDIETIMGAMLSISKNESLLNCCQIVWQAFKKLVHSQFTLNRTTLAFDCFYFLQHKDKNTREIKLYPTQKLLEGCSLIYREHFTQSTLGIVANVTEVSLYKHVATKDRQLLSKELAFKILKSLFSSFKSLLKENNNVQIDLDIFGRIQVYENVFIHEPQYNTSSRHNKGIRVKQIVSPKNARKSSLFRNGLKSSRSSGSLLGEISTQSKFNKLQTQSKHRVSKRSSPYGLYQQSESFGQRFSPTNRYVTPQIRIGSDLLAAGSDPLTYDYTVSKAAQNGTFLMEQEFYKPDPPRVRHPGIIDKFTRTIGCPLNSTKVSSSIIVRIGSNYSPWTRRLCIDNAQKCILYAQPELKITLKSTLNKNPNHQSHVVAATEQEQYQFVVKHEEGMSLQNTVNSFNSFLSLHGDQEICWSKIQERYNIYLRYNEYLEYLIPNSSVAPLSTAIITRILMGTKQICLKVGKMAKQYLKQLINEANVEYYRAYKKAVLHYILKDESEQKRIGIYCTFKPVKQWGFGDKKLIKINQTTKAMTQRAAMELRSRYLQYPQCLLQIACINDKVSHFQFLSLRASERKPMNVLYFIKKQTNHISEVITYLNESWVKKASQVISKHINIGSQPASKVKLLIESVKTIMSNSLKELLYGSLRNMVKFFKRYSEDQYEKKPCPMLLHLTFTEQNGRIIFTDDLSNIFLQELTNIIQKLVAETRKIFSVEYYLRDRQQKYLNGINDDDGILRDSLSQFKIVVSKNIEQIQEVRQGLREYQFIYKFKEEALQWTREQHTMEEAIEKMKLSEQAGRKLDKIPLYIKQRMALIDCVEIKKKLYHTVQSVKCMIYNAMQERIKRMNLQNVQRIEQSIRQLSGQIIKTSDYVILSKALQKVKNIEIVAIRKSIEIVRDMLLGLSSIDYGYTSSQLLQKIYRTQLMYQGINKKLQHHQRRVNNQKLQLEKTLREKISNFQNIISTHLKEAVEQIDTHNIRKSYQDYLDKIQRHKLKSLQFKNTIEQLNKEQQDLSWAITSFTPALDLEIVVDSNLETWKLVGRFDKLTREWRNIELSAMDPNDCQSKMKQLGDSTAKVLKKLRNFNALKIGHELNNDIKEVLLQQIQILRIFSHPGLKDRHWHLFNKKLMIPGYDLKEIPYGKIKMLYDYEKNLKVLMSISNQAAKEFQIENEKSQMQDYWARLLLQTYTYEGEGILCVNEDFLDEQISKIESQTIRTGLLKNSPFSKVLAQMLAQWEDWLVNGRKILQGLRKAQERYISIKFAFSNEQVSKCVPIQNTQFQSLQSIWKSILKRMVQQPKFVDFCKNQKMLQLLQQVCKKIDFAKNGIAIYLNAKRAEFPRLFYMRDWELLQLIGLINQKQKHSTVFNYFIRRCFKGVESIVLQQDCYVGLRSHIDNLSFKLINILPRKCRNKTFKDLKAIEAVSKKSLQKQVKILIKSDYIKKNARKEALNVQVQEAIPSISIKPKRAHASMMSIRPVQKGLSHFSKLAEKQTAKETTNIERADHESSVTADSCCLTALRCFNEVKHTQQLQKGFDNISIENYRRKLYEHIRLSFRDLGIPSPESNDHKQEPEEKTQRIKSIKIDILIGQLLSHYDSVLRLLKQNSIMKLQESFEWASQLKYYLNWETQQVHIKVFDKTLSYEYQFYGHQVASFVPNFTLRYMHHLISSICSNENPSIVISRQNYTPAINTMCMLANVSGRYIQTVGPQFVQTIISNVHQDMLAKVTYRNYVNGTPYSNGNSNNQYGIKETINKNNELQSLLTGLVSCGYWTILNSSYWVCSRGCSRCSSQCQSIQNSVRKEKYHEFLWSTSGNTENISQAALCKAAWSISIVRQHLAESQYGKSPKMDYVSIRGKEVKVNPYTACFLIHNSNNHLPIHRQLLCNFRNLSMISPLSHLIFGIKETMTDIIDGSKDLSNTEQQISWQLIKLIPQGTCNILSTIKFVCSMFEVLLTSNHSRTGSFSSLNNCRTPVFFLSKLLKPIKPEILKSFMNPNEQLGDTVDAEPRQLHTQFIEWFVLRLQEVLPSFVANQIDADWVLHIFSHLFQLQSCDLDRILKAREIEQLPVIQLERERSQLQCSINSHFQPFVPSFIQANQYSKDFSALEGAITTSKCFQNIIVYGDATYKSYLIQEVFKKQHIQHFLEHRVNLAIITNQEQKILNTKSYLKKTLREIQRANKQHGIKQQKKRDLWLITDGDVTLFQIQCISSMDYTLELSNLIHHSDCQGRIRHIVELSEINHLPPSSVCDFAKIFINRDLISSKEIYTQWKRIANQKIMFKSNEVEVLESLECVFEQIMTCSQRMKRNSLQAESSPLSCHRVVTCRRVLKLFQIYLKNLRSKQIQQLPEFDYEDYIRNSFSFAIYWALGVSVLHEQELRNLEGTIRSFFKSALELDGQIYDYFLNQENQWINWQTLQEDFMPQKETQTAYNLWVPTTQNTRLYTMVIKHIENGCSLTLCGDNCGKSTLLKEISNFQISYSSFLIDCNKFTSSQHIYNILKHKIIFGQYEKNLIMIDDINLPIQINRSSAELLRIVMDQQCLTNLESVGKLRKSLKTSTALFALSVNGLGQASNQNISSLKRMLRKTQVVPLAAISIRQIENIFKPYINYSFAMNELTQSVIRSQSSILILILKSIKASEGIFTVHDVRRLVQRLCMLKATDVTDKHSIINHTGWLLFELGKAKILQEDFRVLFHKSLYEQTMKALSMSNKNFLEWQNKMNNHIFTDLNGLSGGHFQDVNTNQNHEIDTFQQIFQSIYQGKGENFIACSKFHTKIIISLLNVFRGASSHVILVGHRGSGSKTLLRMTTLVNNLVHIDLSTMTIENFVNDTLNVIKTGGKVDECVCVLANDFRLRETYMGILNSLATSPEFQDLFSEIQIEQTIKSFNSDKKFIKKDIKKSELIKKIREKVNNIFHCAICLDKETLQSIRISYPNLLKVSTWIGVSQWPQQAISCIARQTLAKYEDGEEFIKPILTLTQAVKNLIIQHNKRHNNYIKQQDNFTSLDTFEVINTFQHLKTQFSNRQKQLEKNTDLWGNKINENQQKIDELTSDKQTLISQHQKQNLKLTNLKESIQDKKKSIEQHLIQIKKVEPEYDEQRTKQEEIESSIIFLKGQLKTAIDQIEFKCLKGSQGLKFKLVFLEELPDQRVRAAVTFFQALNDGVQFQIENAEQLLFNLKDLNNNIDGQLSDGNFEKISRALDSVPIDFFSLTQKEAELYQMQFLYNGEKSSQEVIITLTVIKWFEKLSAYIKSMIQKLERKIKFDLEFSALQKKYFGAKNSICELQDQIEELNESLDQAETGLEQYNKELEQINERVNHSQRIRQILEKFKGVLQSKINNTKAPSLRDVTGSLMCLSIILTYGGSFSHSFIINELTNLFDKTLAGFGLKYNEKHIRSLFSFQDRNKFEHSYENNNLLQEIAFAAISFCDLFCLCVDQEGLLYSWAQKQFGTTIKYKFFDESHLSEIKTCLVQGQCAFIRQPSESFLKTWNKYLNRKLVYKANTALIDIDGQIVINATSKVVFVYDSYQLIPSSLRSAANWIVRVGQDYISMRKKVLRICRQLKYRQLEQKIPTPIQTIVEKYLAKLDQISGLEQKTHIMIQKLKRNLNQSDSISKRIQDISVSKASLQADIQKYGLLIQAQRQQIDNSNPNFANDIAKFYINQCQVNSKRLKIHQFLLILNSYVSEIIHKGDISNFSSSFQQILDNSFLRQSPQNIFRNAAQTQFNPFNLKNQQDRLNFLQQMLSQKGGVQRSIQKLRNLYSHNAISSSCKVLQLLLKGVLSISLSPQNMKQRTIIIQTDCCDGVKDGIEFILNKSGHKFYRNTFTSLLDKSVQSDIVIGHQVCTIGQWDQLEKQYEVKKAKQESQTLSIILTSIEIPSKFYNVFCLKIRLQDICLINAAAHFQRHLQNGHLAHYITLADLFHRRESTSQSSWELFWMALVSNTDLQSRLQLKFKNRQTRRDLVAEFILRKHNIDR